MTTVVWLSTYDAVTYYVARDRTAAWAVCVAATIVAVAQALTVVPIGLLILPVLLAKFGHEAVASAELFLFAQAIGLVAVTMFSVLQGALEFRRFNLGRISFYVTLLAGFAILWHGHRLTVRSIVLTYFAANVLAALTGAALVAPLRERLARSDWLGRLRPVLTYGLKAHSGNVAGLANERLDLALIALFLAPSALGLYSVASTMASVIGVIGSAISLVALPHIATQKTADERFQATIRFAALAALGAGCLSVFGIIAAPNLIGLVFGSAYKPAAPSARILLAAAVILSTNRVLVAALKAAGQPLASGVAELVALVVTLVALWILVPRLGIMGAAIASLLAYLVSGTYMVVRLGAWRELPRPRMR